MIKWPKKWSPEDGWPTTSLLEPTTLREPRVWKSLDNLLRKTQSVTRNTPNQSCVAVLVEYLGGPPPSRRTWSKDKIAEAMKAYRTNHEHFPNTQERAPIEGDGRTWSAANEYLNKHHNSGLSDLGYEVDGRMRGEDVTEEDVKRTIADAFRAGIHPTFKTKGKCSLGIRWDTLAAICIRKLGKSLVYYRDGIWDPPPPKPPKCEMTREEFDSEVDRLRRQLKREPQHKDWKEAVRAQKLTRNYPWNPCQYFKQSGGPPLSWRELLGHQRRPSLAKHRHVRDAKGINTRQAWDRAHEAGDLSVDFFSSEYLRRADPGFFTDASPAGADHHGAHSTKLIKQIHADIRAGKGTMEIARTRKVNRTTVTEIRMGRHYSCNL